MYAEHDRARLAVETTDGLPLRAKTHPFPEDPGRPPFGRDYDRLIHTAAFRRLQGKTQVVTPGQSDFFRTRLTHTIEVAQIARRLAYRLTREVDERFAAEAADVCEAAAILHDFGHPPFGHIGEHALHAALEKVAAKGRWMVDFERLGGYEGNAQSFRQAVWSFRRARDDDRGLQLTRAVLDASIKYPWSYSRSAPVPSKWNYYPSEDWAFEWVREDVVGTGKSFEAQVMDWSDDVAYTTHDIEDWWHAGYIPLTMLCQSKAARQHLADEVVAATSNRINATKSHVESTIENLFGVSGAFANFHDLGTEYDGSSEAKEAMRHLKSELFTKFVNGARAEGDIALGRHRAKLVIDDQVRLENAILKQLVWTFVIEHPRMATHQRGQRAVVSFLVETYASLVCEGNASSLDVLPRDRRERIKRLKQQADRSGNKHEVLRLIADHVAGMTDAYATMMHQRLSGQVSGHINAFV
ncbi:deoxyguanosinetriphosphate triphosphohydrolase family protein [Saccharothrix sp. Mg75]|uniref:deoxyguanosinetriphosphate triphosphohydrolase family protein n=1 Tax=Saccharothrix sp. Mg75 TaxID=3445357 RepID=UPI003EEE3CD7